MRGEFLGRISQERNEAAQLSDKFDFVRNQIMSPLWSYYGMWRLSDCDSGKAK